MDLPLVNECIKMQNAKMMAALKHKVGRIDKLKFEESNQIKFQFFFFGKLEELHHYF